jgi:hypothetical protein
MFELIRLTMSDTYDLVAVMSGADIHDNRERLHLPLNSVSSKSLSFLLKYIDGCADKAADGHWAAK